MHTVQDVAAEVADTCASRRCSAPTTAPARCDPLQDCCRPPIGDQAFPQTARVWPSEAAQRLEGDVCPAGGTCAFRLSPWAPAVHLPRGAPAPARLRAGVRQRRHHRRCSRGGRAGVADGGSAGVGGGGGGALRAWPQAVPHVARAGGCRWVCDCCPLYLTHPQVGRGRVG